MTSPATSPTARPRDGHPFVVSDDPADQTFGWCRDCGSVQSLHAADRERQRLAQAHVAEREAARQTRQPVAQDAATVLTYIATRQSDATPPEYVPFADEADAAGQAEVWASEATTDDDVIQVLLVSAHRGTRTVEVLQQF